MTWEGVGSGEVRVGEPVTDQVELGGGVTLPEPVVEVTGNGQPDRRLDYLVVAPRGELVGVTDGIGHTHIISNVSSGRQT